MILCIKLIYSILQTNSTYFFLKMTDIVNRIFFFFLEFPEVQSKNQEK